jgi:hypothetical protein
MYYFIVVINIILSLETRTGSERREYIYWYGDAYDGCEDVGPLARRFICKLCAPVVPCCNKDETV